MTPADRVWDELTALFSSREAADFYGEEVTIAEHMLQAAALAVADGAGDELVAAALLHDVGHLVAPGSSADDRDRHHSSAGERWLRERFHGTIPALVGRHVDAKRFLVATEPAYAGQLSPASVHTLALQGGPMTETEARAFAADPLSDAAVRVRRWDEAGKQPGAEVPDLDHYRELISTLVVG